MALLLFSPHTNTNTNANSHYKIALHLDTDYETAKTNGKCSHSVGVYCWIGFCCQIERMMLSGISSEKWGICNMQCAFLKTKRMTEILPSSGEWIDEEKEKWRKLQLDLFTLKFTSQRWYSVLVGRVHRPLNTTLMKCTTVTWTRLCHIFFFSY